jgi:hypothetical protein
MRERDIVAATGYSRERVCQIVWEGLHVDITGTGVPEAATSA